MTNYLTVIHLMPELNINQSPAACIHEWQTVIR